MTTKTTSLRSPVNEPQPSRPQTRNRCSRAPLGAVCSLVFQHFLGSPLRRPRRMFWRCHRLSRPRACSSRTTCAGSANTDSPTAGQQAKGVRLPLDLAVTYTLAFPVHTGEFELQILDLAHVWSNGESDLVDSDDLLALAAAVYMYIKLHLSPKQRYPRCLPELLTAFAALLVRRQPDDVPVLQSASTVQRVVHAEFRMLQQLGCELTTLTTMAWVDIFRQRSTLRSDSYRETSCISSSRQLVLTPSLSLLISLPQPSFGVSPLQSHLHSQPSWCGCSVCLCASLVAPRLSRPAVSSRSVACPLSRQATCFNPVAPTFSPIAMFFLFAVPALHSSRTHIKLDTSFQRSGEKKKSSVISDTGADTGAAPLVTSFKV